MRIQDGELVLRELNTEDAPHVQQWFCTENLRYLGGLELTPQSAEQGIVNNYANAAEIPRIHHWLAIDHKATTVGCVTLSIIAPGTGDIGWMLHPDHQGHGYATRGARALMAYGFPTLALTRIQATPHPDNLLSRAVAERLGMTLEHVQGLTATYATINPDPA